MSRQQLTILFIALGLLAILFGGLIAFQRDLIAPTANTPANSSAVTIHDITIGVPTSGTSVNALNQKDRYYSDERLGLRVNATASASYTVSVRLVDEQNQITPLSPSQLTLQPGSDGHCCWMIPNGGEYLLQVLRPDGVITSTDLSIRERRAQTPSL